MSLKWKARGTWRCVEGGRVWIYVWSQWREIKRRGRGSGGGMDGKGWEQQRNRRRRGKMKRGCAKERVIEMTRSWLKSKWHGRKGGERAEGRKRTNGKEWYINGSWRSKWGKWMSGNGGVEEREWKKCGAEQEEEKEEGGGDVRRCEERRGSNRRSAQWKCTWS